MTVRRACSSARTKRFIAPSAKAETGWCRKPRERSFAVRPLHLTIAFANRCATFVSGNQKQSAIAFRLLKGATGRCSASDSPTECSGPPHLLGPWGSAGLGGGASGLLMTSLRAGHQLRPRAGCFVIRLQKPTPFRSKKPGTKPGHAIPFQPYYLIFASRNSTCFLATGSYFFF